MQLHIQTVVLPAVVLLTFFCSKTESIACEPLCNNAKCEVITQCPPGQKLIPAGYCSCCLKCVTILRMNQNCTGPSILMGVPPSPDQCAEGLSCINGVCKPSIRFLVRF